MELEEEAEASEIAKYMAHLYFSRGNKASTVEGKLVAVQDIAGIHSRAKCLMYSDWFIGVVYVAGNCPTDICGGFCDSPNGLNKIILDGFPGSRGTGMRSPLTSAFSVHDMPSLQG